MQIKDKTQKNCNNFYKREYEITIQNNLHDSFELDNFSEHVWVRK